MKKIISIILAISVLMSFGIFLSGCDEEETPAAVKKPSTSQSDKDNNSSGDNTSSEDDNSSDNSGSEVIVPNQNTNNEINTSSGSKYDNVAKVKLFKDGEANFVFIRSETANNSVVALARYAYKAIEGTHDVVAANKNDSTPVDTSVIEISIGETNRPRAAALTKEIKSAHGNYGMDYAIVYDNGIIYIVGGSDTALENGVKAFLSYFCADMNGEVPVTFDYRYHINEQNAFKINGKTDLSAYKLIVPKYNLSYLIGREVNTLRDEILYNTGSITPRTADRSGVYTYEIIIGETNRPDTPMPSNTDEYIIKAVGNKIYVIGGDDQGTAFAVKQFIKWVKEGQNLPANLDYLGSVEYDRTEDDYSLAYSDEFDSLDRTTWNISVGGYSQGSDNMIAPRTKYFTDSSDNVYIDNGNLVLKGSYDDEHYYGVEMRTNNSLWFKYGIVETSCKINSSKGLCPAFWLLAGSTNEANAEYDLFEAFGDYLVKNNAIKVTTISHTPAGSKFGQGSLVTYSGAIRAEDSYYTLPEGDTWYSDYHTIGCEWTPTSFKYVIDGDVFVDIDTTQSERDYYTYNGLVQIILTMYAGNDVCSPNTGYPDETTNWADNNFTLDYVRIYQDTNGVLQY